MTREEFNIKCREIDSEYGDTDLSDFRDIEYVYTYYPTISETDGKTQIAQLYMTHGIALIHDMLPRARVAANQESIIRSLQSKLAEAKGEMRCLRIGLSEFDRNPGGN